MKGAVPKTARFVAALALLPFVWAEFAALPALAPDAFAPEFPFVSAGVMSLFGGMALWFAIAWRFRVNPWFYVLGHELTHAFWALLTFSKVGRINVTSRGGFCMISDPGVFTTLAPYFIPFYLVVLLAIRAIAGIWIDMAPYGNLWFAAFGFAYGFHLTNTIESITGVDQPDIREYGRFFSCTLIVAANMLFLLLGFAAVSGTPFGELWNALASSVCSAYAATWECGRASAIAAWRWLSRLAGLGAKAVGQGFGH